MLGKPYFVLADMAPFVRGQVAIIQGSINTSH